MKREYFKPYLAVDSFQLDAAIAGACMSGGKIPINQSVEACTLLDESEGTDLTFGGACFENIMYGDGVNPDGSCYQMFIGSDMFLTS